MLKSLSHVQLSATPWTVACQIGRGGLCPWGFSRQEYWSGLPYSSLGDLPNPGIKSVSPALQADRLPSEPPGKPWVSLINNNLLIFRLPAPGYKRLYNMTLPTFPSGASLMAQMVKNLPTRQETWVRSLGWEDPLEKGMTTHSSILA